MRIWRVRRERGWEVSSSSSPSFSVGDAEEEEEEDGVFSRPAASPALLLLDLEGESSGAQQRSVSVSR